MSFEIRNKKTGKVIKVSPETFEKAYRAQVANGEWEYFMPTQRGSISESESYLRKRGFVK